ncbi:MAG: hypothetical protein GY796_30040 [Chloroflexi bacterium]|nr:hypothetical protein [Chloroflexota bacterium]
MPEFGEVLSKRELEVLVCLSQGAGNKDIAADLSISQNTVKVHLRNIYTKLGVSSRTEAAAVALQQGMITMPGVDVKTAVPPPDPPPPTSEPENTPEPEQLSPPPARHRWRNWRTAAVLLTVLTLIVLIVGTVYIIQSLSETTVFEPTDLGENWSAIRPLPQPRANMATAAVGLNLYVIGGDMAGQPVDSALVYDSAVHEWVEAVAKPTAVTDTTAAALFGEIFVPGGRLADGQPTNIVEAYSPANNSWRPVQSLPHPISGGLTVTDGSFLYLLGGWDGVNYLDTAYVYDPGENRWQPLPPMSHPRANLAGDTLTGKLLAVGGYNGETAVPTCELYDSATQIWTVCPDMLSPRQGAGAATIVNKLYVIGGVTDEGETAAFSEVYNPANETWTIVNTPMLTDKPAWPGLGVSHVETRLFAFGGKRDGEAAADTYMYAPLVYQTFLPAASSDSDK